MNPKTAMVKKDDISAIITQLLSYNINRTEAVNQLFELFENHSPIFSMDMFDKDGRYICTTHTHDVCESMQIMSLFAQIMRDSGYKSQVGIVDVNACKINVNFRS